MHPAFFIFIISLLFTTTAYSQGHGAHWPVYGWENGAYQYALIDFNQQPPSINRVPGAGEYTGLTTAFSDSLGNLLFYVNGNTLKRRNHQDMAGGDSISDTGIHGYSGAFALPYPGQSGKYCYFHADLDDSNLPLTYTNAYFYVSVIDMEADNGLGAVVSADHLLVTDTLLDISACKHGNGRDWWIIIPTQNHPRFYIFLLSPDGLEGPFIQDFQFEIGQYMGALFPGNMRSSLSPDGRHFIRSHTPDSLAWYQFDRCEGQFAFQGSLFTTTRFMYRGCFGPGSRMFYYNAVGGGLFHLDLHAWEAGIDTLRLAPVSTTQTAALSLADDGRIYAVSTLGGSRALHAILRPDYPPSAEDYAFNIIPLDLPLSNFSPLPSLPNYRLGAWEDAICDTLALRPGETNRAFQRLPFSKNDVLSENRGRWDTSKAVRRRLF